MKIALASDHGGFGLKEAIRKHLEQTNNEVFDFGTFDVQSVDYPDYAEKAALAVQNGSCERGILICSTGIGISISANKVKGIRCALCGDLLSARLTREHNDTNMLALGAFIVAEKLALAIVDEWIKTPYSNEDRHTKRIEKIAQIEQKML